MDFSIGDLLTGFMGLGTAVRAVGSYESSKMTKKALETQAVVNQNNAQYADWQAEDALQRGADAEVAHGVKVANLRGTQRATLAARGVALEEGSPLNILADTEQMGAADAAVIRANAGKEAWGHRVQASNYRNNAGVLNARADAENPLLNASSTLLTGAGMVADRWYSYSKTVN